MKNEATPRPRTAHELKAEERRRYDELFAECGVFWAFSAEQFEKNKTPLSEGDKYVSIGAGGYMPKSRAADLAEGMEQIRKEHNAAVKANRKLRRDVIAYELRNHEATYTGDISDTLDALGDGYSAKEVRKIYQELLNAENA